MIVGRGIRWTVPHVEHHGLQELLGPGDRISPFPIRFTTRQGRTVISMDPRCRVRFRIFMLRYVFGQTGVADRNGNTVCG